MSEKRRDNRNRILKDNEMQRPDGRYMYAYIDPLTQKRHFVYSWKLERHDKMPAGKRPDISLREKEQQIAQDIFNGVCQDKNMSVIKLVEMYLEQKNNVRNTTRYGYGTVMNVLKKEPFGNKKIKSITVMDAKHFLVYLQKEKKKSYSSVKTIRGVLRPAFQMAYESDLIRKNPFAFELADLLIDDSVKREALTLKQERTFLEFVKNDEHFSQYYDGMFILFKTGLRIAEFCGLTIKDIDLKERTINVEKQLQYTGKKKKYVQPMPKTESGKRVLPMTNEVYEAFKRVLANRKVPKVEEMVDGVSWFIWLNTKGTVTPPYYWEKKFNYAVSKYNSIYKLQLPNITPHICRHTYASNLAKSGVSVKTLQYMMGHSDVSTSLQIYTHYHLEDVRADIDSKCNQSGEVKKA